MEPAQSINESYYLKQIIELKDEIIKLQKSIIEKDQIIAKDKEVINELQNELRLKQEKEKDQKAELITPNKNFNILEKEVLFKDIGSHEIFTIYILRDGRLATGNASGNIIIYNLNNHKSEMTIKESSYIMYLTQLKNGYFVSLLSDGSINIYNLLENYKYLLLQKIKAHSARVHKLRVLDDNDNRFMTCSDDCTIKFTNVKKLYNGLTDNLYKLNDTYLLVGATNAILIFDVNQHRQIREIESLNSDLITSFLKLDNKCLLSVDCNGNIKQWIIDGDNLILENVKNRAHEGQIRMIRRNEEGFIITCSDDKSIKVWK